MSLISARELADCTTSERYERLLHTGAYSDIKITCQGSEFNVHRTVLIASGGDFFRAAILGPWKEAATSVIDLPEDEPSIIARVLFYIYTGHYPVQMAFKEPSQLASIAEVISNEPETEETLGEIMQIHSDIFAMAVKFGMTDLPLEAKIQFLKAILDAKEQLAISNDYNFAGQLGLSKVIKELYDSPIESVRELQIIVAAEVAADINEHKDDDKAYPGEKTLQEVPKLVMDLFMGFFGGRDDIPKIYCEEEEESKFLWLPSCKCRKLNTLCKEEECTKAYAEHSFCRNCLAYDKKIVLVTPKS